MGEKEELLYNLLALGFDVQTQEIKHGCQYDANMFDKPNKRAFEVVTHFLFHKLEPKQATNLFRTCFPGTGKKCTLEFRKVTFNWLKKIYEENPNFGIPKVTSTLLMSPGGKDFIHLMFNFSRFVLYKRLHALQPHGVLYSPIAAKSNRVKPQLTVYQSMTVSNFKQLQAQMQLIKKTDEDLQNFADQQIDAYHALQKKKKQLLQERKQCLGNAASYSEIKMVEHKKQQSRNLAKKIETAKSMWDTVSACVDDAAPHREIIESVLSSEGQGFQLDGSKLQPTIPAKLIHECQEEIYQTIGTSLYENGKINLKSLVALGTLSLNLLADTIHEEGFPNFEKQNVWLKTRSQIHQDELSNLTSMKNSMEKEKIRMSNSIHETEKKLDAIYASRPSKTDEVGLDVPDATFDSGKQLSSEGEDVQYQDLPLSKAGIAAEYLLPSGDKELFLEGLFLHSDDETPTLPADLHDVAVTSHHDDSPKAWSIPGIDLSSSYSLTPVSRKSKVHKPSSSHKTGKPLKQGKTKRLDIPTRSSRSSKIKDSSYLKASFGIHSNPASPKVPSSRGRLSMSLPSSPLMTYRSDDVIVQKVTSRTPEAESRLIDQIARYTCEDSDSSPLIVYEQNGKSQLDRTAFVSRDKIPRTPPGLSQTSSTEMSNLSAMADTSDDELSIRYPPCGIMKKTGTVKGAARFDSHTDSPSSIISDLPKDYSNVISRDASSFSSKLTTDNSSAMSAIDNALESMIEENSSGILDVSTPLFTDVAEFDDTVKEFHFPATDKLISIELADEANCSQMSPKLQDRSGARAIDLLMSTPPPLLDANAAKENNSPLLPAASESSSILPPTTSDKSIFSTASKDSLPSTPERPLLQQFQLNLLPVPDFQTPELQHFKSVLKRK